MLTTKNENWVDKWVEHDEIFSTPARKEGFNPKIHCGDCFGIAPSREKRLDSDPPVEGLPELVIKPYTDFEPIRHTETCELLRGYPMCLCLNRRPKHNS